MGDTALSIPLLSLAHSSTYKCKVKKSARVDMLKVLLAVMGKTSPVLATTPAGGVTLSLTKITPESVQRGHFPYSILTFYLIVNLSRRH